jgi:hypothetical protein
LLATAFRFAAANDLEKAAIISAEEIDPIKRIISILNWYAPSEQSRSWLLWIDGWSAGRWNPKITEALAEINESWKQLLRLAIKEAVDNGWSPKYSIDQTATRFTIFTDGLSVAELTGPQEFTKSEANTWIEEFVSNELKSNELIQKDNYFVSDIVNPERFKERKNQKIIKSINFNIQKILGEIFGKNNIPQIGKNRPNRFSKSVNQDVINNPLEKTGNAYVQVVNSSNGIFRAYANCFYWLKNIYSDISYRNLGFYSPLQTDLANLFKSFIIDYLLNKKRTKKMISDIGSILKIGENNVDDYLDYFIKSLVPKYISIVDLYILNQLHHIPIIIYDVYDQPFLILDNGIKYLNITGKSVTLPEKSLENYIENNFQYINIKFGTINPSLTSSISNVYSLYFLNK